MCWYALTWAKRSSNPRSRNCRAMEGRVGNASSVECVVGPAGLSGFIGLNEPNVRHSHPTPCSAAPCTCTAASPRAVRARNTGARLVQLALHLALCRPRVEHALHLQGQINTPQTRRWAATVDTAPACTGRRCRQRTQQPQIVSHQPSSTLSSLPLDRPAAPRADHPAQLCGQPIALTLSPTSLSFRNSFLKRRPSCWSALPRVRAVSMPGSCSTSSLDGPTCYTGD